jgi:aspartate racemase
MADSENKDANSMWGSSRTAYRQIIARMVEHGAEGIILGCTEIMLLIGAKDSPVPIFDTTALHAAAAIEQALET